VKLLISTWELPPQTIWTESECYVSHTQPHVKAMRQAGLLTDEGWNVQQLHIKHLGNISRGEGAYLRSRQPLCHPLIICKVVPNYSQLFQGQVLNIWFPVLGIWFLASAFWFTDWEKNLNFQNLRAP
jgi:hypothetical protein